MPSASGIPVYCAHDKIVKLGKLKPNPRNPNTHPDEQIRLLAKIIQAQGWRAPITVSNLSGLIVRGHARREAALLAGWGEAPVDFQDYENEEAEWADLIADNRLAELATTDRPGLVAMLGELGERDIDLELTGFTEQVFSDLKHLEGAPPLEFPEKDESIADDVEYIDCPKCGHRWPK